MRRNSVVILLLSAGLSWSAPPNHTIVFHERETFAGWPANNGIWSWDGGQEAVVGFVTGKFELRNGHNLVRPYTNRLARTTDGGTTWQIEKGEGYYQPEQKPKLKPEPLTDAIAFDDPNLALRFYGDGYHGGSPGTSAMCYSRDRGKTWAGPFALPTLVPADDKSGLTEVTLRTDYRVPGRSECLVFGSARAPGIKDSDRVFAARLSDGGRKGELLGWVAAADSPNRAVMPATVALGTGKFYMAIRASKDGTNQNWIDGYLSTNDAKTWEMVGRVCETGRTGGNPPALIRLNDGRLACAYGDRTRKKLFARLSEDAGKTWGDEVLLRDDYAPDEQGEIDLGYPRLFQRRDGAVVAVYYWATKSEPTNHIAATVWSPPNSKR